MDVIEVQRWAYVQDLPGDIGPVRQLLRTYSRIPEEHVDSHLRRVRENAWVVARCPFVGRWRFLRLHDSRDACYQQVVFRLSVSGSRDVFLDLGCCVGQVLRQLRAAGVHGPRLIGTDIQPRFVDIGYDLFRDRDRLGASFVIGDMADPDDGRLDELRGKVTIIYAGSFFHLFTWAQQLFIGKRLVSFLQPSTRNALIYGRHVGTTRPGVLSAGITAAYLHDHDSFQRLWDEVGALTRTRWKVEMEVMAELACHTQRVDKGSRLMSFTIFQIS